VWYFCWKCHNIFKSKEERNEHYMATEGIPYPEIMDKHYGKDK
jgi:hypothetical protein